MSTIKPSNPSAFPLEYEEYNSLKRREFGMSLRDYFANSAMQSVITRLGGAPLCKASDQDIFNLVSEEAYKYADAMLKQREK